MRSVSLLLMWVLVVTPGISSAAEAKPPKEKEAMAEAKRHYKAAAAHYEAGRYAAAHLEFQAAYEISQLPELLYNLGRVADKRGEPGEAIRYYESYLKDKPDTPDREKIESELERLRKQIGIKEEPAAPVPEPTATTPPPVVAVAIPDPPLPPPSPSRRPPIGAISLLAGGAAFLVVGVALGGAALSAAAAVKAGPYWDPALDQKGVSLSNAAIAFDVLGAVALLGGAAWTGVWLYHRGKPPAEASLRLVPGPGGILVSGGF